MGLAGGSTTGAGFETGIGLMPGVELILGVVLYKWLFAVLIAHRGGLFAFGLRRLYRILSFLTRYYTSTLDQHLKRNKEIDICQTRIFCQLMHLSTGIIGMAYTPLARQTFTACQEHSPTNCNQFHQGQEMRITLQRPPLSTRGMRHKYSADTIKMVI